MKKKESKSEEFLNGEAVFFEVEGKHGKKSRIDTLIVVSSILINNGEHRMVELMPNKSDSDIEKVRIYYKIKKPFEESSSAPTSINHVFNPQPHYDNSKGSLYKVAEERGWSSYLFDVVKRLERSEKKGQFESDLDKSIDVIKIWKSEKE